MKVNIYRIKRYQALNNIYVGKDKTWNCRKSKQKQFQNTSNRNMSWEIKAETGQGITEILRLKQY